MPINRTMRGYYSVKALYFVCIFSSKKYFWSEGLLLLNEKMLCHLRLDSFQFLNSRKAYSKSYHACSRKIVQLFWFFVWSMISLDTKCIWLKPKICRSIEEGRLLPILPLHEVPGCGNAAPGSAGQAIFCTGLSATEWSCEGSGQGSGCCCCTAGTAATTAWSGWDDRREDSPFEARTPQRTTYAHAKWGKGTEYIKSLIPNSSARYSRACVTRCKRNSRYSGVWRMATRSFASSSSTTTAIFSSVHIGAIWSVISVHILYRKWNANRFLKTRPAEK